MSEANEGTDITIDTPASPVVEVEAGEEGAKQANDARGALATALEKMLESVRAGKVKALGCFALVSEECEVTNILHCGKDDLLAFVGLTATYYRDLCTFVPSAAPQGLNPIEQQQVAQIFNALAKEANVPRILQRGETSRSKYGN
jgi:hypothetical protein